MLPILLISNNKKVIDKYITSRLLDQDTLFFEMAPEGTKYLISQVKEVLRQTFIFNPKKRVYFFPDFHASTLEAQNAFLKGLEEGPENVQFVLSTDSTTHLLPTIVSRTKVVSLQKSSRFKPDLVVQKELSLMLDKKNLRTFNMGAIEVKNKEEAVAVVEQFVFFFRGKLSSDAKAASILKEILHTQSLIIGNNLAPQLAIDHILIFVAKAYNMKI